MARVRFQLDFIFRRWKSSPEYHLIWTRDGVRSDYLEEVLSQTVQTKNFVDRVIDRVLFMIRSIVRSLTYVLVSLTHKRHRPNRDDSSMSFWTLRTDNSGFKRLVKGKYKKWRLSTPNPYLRTPSLYSYLYLQHTIQSLMTIRPNYYRLLKT